MKVLLVDALAAGSGKRRSSLDVIGAGPRAIAGVLEVNGIQYNLRTAEDALRRPPKDVDVLMVSAMTMDAPVALKIARKYRHAVKILGGPITTDPTQVSLLGYDLGVWGEGEVALDSIIKSGGLEDPSNIPPETPNVIRVKRGRAVLGPTQRISRDELNTYRPSTEAVEYYTSTPHFRYARVYVEVERGCSNYLRPLLTANRKICKSCGSCLGRRAPVQECPQGIPPGCGYCSIPAVYGYPKSREKEAITAEVADLVSRRVQRVILSGADFLDFGRDEVALPIDPCEPGPNLSAVEDLLDGIRRVPEIRRGEVYVGIENVKPCLLTDEAIDLILGCLPDSVIHVGVETGDDAHSWLLGRPCPSSFTAERVIAAAQAGLRVYAYFIHGLPGQTAKTVAATVSMIERFYEAGVEKVTVYRFKPLPGSAFERMPPGPPASKDRLSGMIESAARQFNLRRKRQMVGSKLEVVMSGDVVTKYRVAYPFKEGPTCFVKGVPKNVPLGERAIVKVTSARSDRALVARYIGPA